MRARRRCPTPWLLLVWLLVLPPGCGGGADGGGALGAYRVTPPYSLRWMGRVAQTIDGNGTPVAVPGVSVGDTCSVVMHYDPATFGPGVNTSADAYDYASPLGTRMEYLFSSSVSGTRIVTRIRAVDRGPTDQWLVASESEVLFIASDFHDASFDAPFPASFVDMHQIILDSLSNMRGSAGSVEIVSSDVPEERRLAFVEVTGWGIVEN